MKNFKIYLVVAMIGLTALTFTSCKKGEDDPGLSFRSRKARFTNTWVLTKYEKNGAAQDISGTTYTYDVFNNGSLTRIVDGTVFGFATRTEKNGSWEFANNKEDVKITIDNNAEIYNIQRLATDELWLKMLKDGDTHIYYFESKQ